MKICIYYIPDGENLGESQQFKKKNNDDEGSGGEIEKNTKNENNVKNEDKNDEIKIMIKKPENEIKIFEQDVKIDKISNRQWAYMIIFCLGIISIIPGVAIFEWTITQMAAVFFILTIIFIFLFNKKDKAIKTFLEGAGGFCGVGII